MADLHIGIMSGTSLDGVDAVLVDWESRISLAFSSRPYPVELKSELLSLCAEGPNELERAGDVSQKLSRIYADAVSDVLRVANIRSNQVKSIGCHGQTVRHRPERGFTVQLQNPSLLAELTRITVVADFRSRDLAAGGQGAPLAPAFHDGVFRHASKRRAVVNIGGISNVSLLLPGVPVSGFDCGPGNVLMDHWANHHLGTPFDQDGAWAAGGTVRADLLGEFVSESYFSLPPPKSTGRELFNAEWLARKLMNRDVAARDVQATLLDFTALTVSSAVRTQCADCDELIVCGGGARNPRLMRRIQELSGIQTEPSDAYGIPSGQVEAMAFAWFAKCAIDRTPLALHSITGSAHPLVLGAIYPA